jgi:hypothetical protein
MILLATILASVSWAVQPIDDRDDAVGVALGSTVVVRNDGTITRITEREAMSAPWTGTARGVSIGSVEGQGLAWPMATAQRSIGRALWLADGRCFVGSPEVGDGVVPAGTIRWRVGPMVIDVPLTDLRGWTAPGVALPSGSVDMDRVTLRNGDVVDGLVTSIGATVVVDTDAGQRTITDDLVASIQFVQAGEARPVPRVLRVWIDDGSIIDVESIERDGTLLRMKVPSPSGGVFLLRLRVDEVLGVATPALSIDGLSIRQAAAPPGIVPGTDPGTEVLGPARLGSMEAILRGPGRWSIPITSAGALIGRVIIPDRVRAIGDHALVLRQAGVELARIEARSDVRSFRVDVKPGAVDLELVPGKAGPVGCMVEVVDLVQVSAAP